MSKMIISGITVALLVLVGAVAFIAIQNNGTSINNQNMLPVATAFDMPVTFSLNQQKTFTDGLQVKLTAINDSRCKAGVVCVWAGELAAQFNLSSGTIGQTQKEITLGTVNTKSLAVGGYTITLESATETSATITVTHGNAQASCFIGGCSNQLCSDQPGAVSTCEYTQAYACYQTATCARQQNGQCGWSQTIELTSCLQGK